MRDARSRSWRLTELSAAHNSWRTTGLVSTEGEKVHLEPCVLTPVSNLKLPLYRLIPVEVTLNHRARLVAHHRQPLTLHHVFPHRWLGRVHSLDDILHNPITRVSTSVRARSDPARRGKWGAAFDSQYQQGLTTTNTSQSALDRHSPARLAFNQLTNRAPLEPNPHLPLPHRPELVLPPLQDHLGVPVLGVHHRHRLGRPGRAGLEGKRGRECLPAGKCGAEQWGREAHGGLGSVGGRCGRASGWGKPAGEADMGRSAAVPSGDRAPTREGPSVRSAF